jgi:hypothetical protein
MVTKGAMPVKLAPDTVNHKGRLKPDHVKGLVPLLALSGCVYEVPEVVD